MVEFVFGDYCFDFFISNVVLVEGFDNENGFFVVGFVNDFVEGVVYFWVYFGFVGWCVNY